jgi:hypothetical protein
MHLISSTNGAYLEGNRMRRAQNVFKLNNIKLKSLGVIGKRWLVYKGN